MRIWNQVRDLTHRHTEESNTEEPIEISTFRLSSCIVEVTVKVALSHFRKQLSRQSSTSHSMYMSNSGVSLTTVYYNSSYRIVINIK